MSWIRNKYAAVLTVALLAQATLFYAASRDEKVTVGPSLDLFPTQLAGWHETDNFPVEQEVKDQLKADDLMNRLYEDPESNKAARAFRGLFQDAAHRPIAALPQELPAWFGMGTRGDGIHRRPGYGQPQPIRINRFVVSHGDETSVVLYWYQSQRRVIASEFSAKFWLVMDSIRYHRSDTALVRVTIPVLNNDRDSATQTGVSFVQRVFPVLKSYLPA